MRACAQRVFVSRVFWRPGDGWDSGSRGLSSSRSVQFLDLARCLFSDLPSYAWQVFLWGTCTDHRNGTCVCVMSCHVPPRWIGWRDVGDTITHRVRDPYQYWRLGRQVALSVFYSPFPSLPPSSSIHRTFHLSRLILTVFPLLSFSRRRPRRSIRDLPEWETDSWSPSSSSRGKLSESEPCSTTAAGSGVHPTRASQILRRGVLRCTRGGRTGDSTPFTWRLRARLFSHPVHVFF